MTISYASVVATTNYSTFLRLLFIYFEWLCVYCNMYNDLIPVPFVLGFYVSLVVSRWWEQFLTLVWPDQLALYLTAFCHGNSDRATMIRRTIMRYTNLAYCLALRSISSRARLRFPTEQHLVDAGLATEEELQLLTNTQPLRYVHYFAPLVWALNVVTMARREGLIRFDRAVELLSEELCSIRGKLGTIYGYDWINLPLVYTQMATIVVYSYFFTCLFAWQYIDASPGNPGYELDIYIPVFGLLRFFFYMGWLKVAESLINPFGEDADDFEIEYLIERNLNVSYLIVDGMHHDHPDLVRDAFWGTTDVVLPDWTRPDEPPGEASTSPVNDGDMLVGSLANMDASGRKMSAVFRRKTSLVNPFTSMSSLRKVSNF